MNAHEIMFKKWFSTRRPEFWKSGDILVHPYDRKFYMLLHNKSHRSGRLYRQFQMIDDKGNIEEFDPYVLLLVQEDKL